MANPSVGEINIPDSEVKIRDFPGLMSYPDPNDIPAGASTIQINIVSLRPGEMRVRGGYKIVKFVS